MLLNILHTIADFAVLVTRLTTEEFADEQRMVLIDQFMRLQGFDAAFEFDLHDLLMVLITVLIIIFWLHYTLEDLEQDRKFIERLPS